MNLYVETLEVLNDRGKSPEDVLWVGNKNIWFTFDDFHKLSNKEYDRGFGSQEVYPELLIVGKNWWLERHEYDGSEWWEYKKLPVKPAKNIIPDSLFDDGNYNFDKKFGDSE